MQVLHSTFFLSCSCSYLDYPWRSPTSTASLVLPEFCRWALDAVPSSATPRPGGRGLSRALSLALSCQGGQAGGPSTPTHPRNPLLCFETWCKGLSAKQNLNEKCWYLMKYKFEDFTKEICCRCFNLLEESYVQMVYTELFPDCTPK